MSKYEALKKADNDSWATVVRCGYSRDKEYSAIIKYESAHHILREYERKAAEMHEELVAELQIHVNMMSCSKKCETCNHAKKNNMKCTCKDMVELLARAKAL